MQAAALNKIKLILFDVDGVLTDGNITYTDKGVEIKDFNVQDGLGITMARLAGFKTGIISSRKSKAIDLRAKQLKIDVISQGNLRKLSEYNRLRESLNLTDEQVCYIGDDLLDLPVLRKAGFAVAVANAREEVKKECDYITTVSGGHGAVREVIDMILKRQEKFETVLNHLTE